MQIGTKIGGLGLLTLFLIASFAAVGFFLYYASEWSENSDRNDAIRAEYGYEGAVIGMLMILAGFHGVVIMNDLL